MKRDRVGEWWTSLPDGPYTCQGCGRIDSKTHVQPQYPARDLPGLGALCVLCIGAENLRRKQARKQYLGSLDRCSLCTRRGTYKVGGAGVLMCGRHMKAAKREWWRTYGGNPMPWLEPPALSPEQTKELARKGARKCP
jgi:hypothetical protein